MPSPRPRRAMPAPLGARIARIAVPVLLVGGGATAIALSVWPAGSQLGTPATSAIPSVAASSAAASGDASQSPSAPPMTPPTPSAPPSATPTTPAAKSTSGPAAKPKASAKPKAKSKPKPSASASPKLKVTDTKFASIALNVRVKPTQDAKVVGEIKAGDKVPVTDTVKGDYRLISFKKKGYWVKKKYLVDDKTSVTGAAGISSQPCTTSSGVESGLTPDARKVYRAVCANFPQVRSFGGNRGGGGNHGSGRAVDAMLGGADGGAIASWVRAHARQLGVSEVIYAQRIWTVQRGGDGWRSMSDRGSATANHYDHVHISVYGDRATD